MTFIYMIAVGMLHLLGDPVVFVDAVNDGLGANIDGYFMLLIGLIIAMIIDS